MTAQRRAEIARMLEKQGAVEVDALMAHFGVSAPTIRRDLGWLAAQGMARRVRGGAVAISSGVPLPSSSRVGPAAAALVQDGETVFVGPGRLALETAQALCPRQHLTVITNSLDVAVQIATHSAHALILTGGQQESTINNFY